MSCLVGGVFGVIGYLLTQPMSWLVPGKVNGVAMSIVIVALVSKAIFDTPNLMGKVS